MKSKKIKEYFMVVANNEESFNFQVNNYLQDGWKLFGETTILQVEGRMFPIRYMQALVR